jgi:hypothetical protein
MSFRSGATATKITIYTVDDFNRMFVIPNPARKQKVLPVCAIAPIG